MIPVPSGVRVWLATGHADMRKGWASLALLVQERLGQNPHSGQLFICIFRLNPPSDFGGKRPPKRQDAFAGIRSLSSEAAEAT